MAVLVLVIKPWVDSIYRRLRKARFKTNTATLYIVQHISDIDRNIKTQYTDKEIKIIKDMFLYIERSIILFYTFINHIDNCC